MSMTFTLNKLRCATLLSLALIYALLVSAPPEHERLPLHISSDNHVFIQVTVNHSAPLWFIVDSGAGDLLINKRIAETIGLKLQDRSQTFGVGKDPVEVFVTEAASVSLGKLCSFRKRMLALSMDTFEAYFGRDVAGIIGHDLFSRFVVEIDYLTGVLTLHNPQTYSYAGKGESLPITINGKLAEVQATIKLPGKDPVAAKLILDTGAHLAIALNQPFVESHKLLQSASRTVKDPWSPGLGGDAELLLTRASYLRLGETTLSDPVIAFSQDRAGSLASTAFDGIIGGELLRRFKVIFDYPRRSVVLEPNEHIRERYVYSTEMLGIGLSAAGKDFRSFMAHSIVAGSPAAKAGLQVGDRIAAIDGQPAEALSLDQLRQILKQDRPQYVITIKRGQKTLPVQIKSEKLL